MRFLRFRHGEGVFERWNGGWFGRGKTPPPPAVVPLPFQGRHNESPLKGEMSVELTEGLLCKIENVWEKIYVGTPPPPSAVPLP